MKKFVSLLLTLVLTLGCLSGVSFAAEPIAEVTNGTEVVSVESAAEIKALIKADGTTVVKMLRDYTTSTGFLSGVATVTVDLNGFTVTVTNTQAAVGVNTVGTKNTTTVVKNGTIISRSKSVRANAGGLRMENVNCYAYQDYTVGITQTSGKWNDQNLITGCTIVGAKTYPLAFATKSADHSAVTFTVENSTLIQASMETKRNVIGLNSNTAGTIVLGANVTMMARGSKVADTSKITLTGGTVTKADGTADMAFPQYDAIESIPEAKGMNKWTTPAVVDLPNAPATPTTPETPAAPETPAVPSTPIAEVVNGSEVVQVSTHEEIKALINTDGTTVVKMLRDYTTSTGFLNGIPTVTLDLNGFTVTLTNTQACIAVKTQGSANTLTTIKNGTIIARSKCVRVYEGGMRLENVRAFSFQDFTIGISQTEGKWNADNLITGCYIANPKTACIAFADKEKDYSGVSVKVENTVLASAAETSKVLLLNINSNTSGTIELGKGVVAITRATRVYDPAKVKVTGEALTQTVTGTETLSFPEYAAMEGEITAANMNRWETPKGSFVTDPAKPAVKDFADVAKDFWGYAAIMNAAAAGLVKGKSENADGTMNYVPNASMTRAEFITVICRYFYPTEAAAVKAGDAWWQGYYDLALDKNILAVSDLDYGDLDKAMSREEMALVLSRTAPAQAAYAAVTPAASAAIPDYASVGEYYQTAVLWAYGAGLLKGVDTAGTFNPKGELNRAAVATIFNTLLSSK